MKLLKLKTMNGKFKSYYIRNKDKSKCFKKKKIEKKQKFFLYVLNLKKKYKKSCLITFN